jgi:hypothetical protein
MKKGRMKQGRMKRGRMKRARARMDASEVEPASPATEKRKVSTPVDMASTPIGAWWPFCRARHEERVSFGTGQRGVCVCVCE